MIQDSLQAYGLPHLWQKRTAPFSKNINPGFSLEMEKATSVAATGQDSGLLI